MCGIVALFAKQKSTSPDWLSTPVLASMLDRLAHRGPDGSGHHVNPGCLLGHRRLAIIDPAHGEQPMQTPDKRFTLVANGEIYNHAELREELQAAGHQFHSRCDVEVILHGYAEWGHDVVHRLRGMFAFAIYDNENHALFVARDRLGQKPLYVATLPGGWALASELTALRKLPGIGQEIDLHSLHQYLHYQCIPAPRTIYRGIRKLPPAHTATFSTNGFAQERYWQLSYATSTGISYTEARLQLRELLQDATSIRLMSDVPLGLLLSGGIDSTIVAGLMKHASEGAIHSYSVSFPDTCYDESHYAEMAADHAGTIHHMRAMETCSADLIKDLIHQMDEPFADSSALPLSRICAFARKSLTVALTGDGADEAFAGYERILAQKWLFWLDKIPLSLARRAGNLLLRWYPTQSHERSFDERMRRLAFLATLPTEKRHLQVLSKCPADDQKRLYAPILQDIATDTCPAWGEEIPSSATDLVSRLLEEEVTSYLPDDILVKADRFSMAHGLELRSPFLDHKVMEFAAHLPSHWMLAGHHRKHILIDACQDLLPLRIRNRNKQGFGLPKAEWLRGALAPLLRETLAENDAHVYDWFQPDAIRTLIAEHLSGQRDNANPLWSLLCLELWLAAK